MYVRQLAKLRGHRGSTERLHPFDQVLEVPAKHQGPSGRRLTDLLGSSLCLAGRKVAAEDPLPFADALVEVCLRIRIVNPAVLSLSVNRVRQVPATFMYIGL